MRSAKLISLFAFLLITIFLFSCTKKKSQDQSAIKNAYDSKLIFNATFRGGYHIFHDTTDKKTYYLVDTKLINNTDSDCEFFTMSCASLINIVTNSDQVFFIHHNCAGNYPTLIRLRPKQEFSLPVILYRKGEECSPKVKFGFVLATPEMIKGDPLDEMAIMNRLKENVIWSEPIILSTCSSHPYKIYQEINDSAFIEVDLHQTYK